MRLAPWLQVHRDRFFLATKTADRTGEGARKSLERFPFDSVLLPYNFTMMSNSNYAADFEALLAICAEERVAVQAIKSIARRRWEPDDSSPHYSG